jgi:hypothetical protein
MKILLASSVTQGQCANDFCYVPDGEMVTIETPCAKDTDSNGQPLPDGVCGCARSFTGIFSGKGTTSALVVDVDAGFEALMNACYSQSIWTGEEFAAHVEAMEALLAPFAPNTHIGRRGDALYERQR